MEYQQAVVRAPRMSRINWTQTTMITVAAFVGCLAALGFLFYLYKSFLGKAIRERTRELDRIDAGIRDSEDELADLQYRLEQVRRRSTKVYASDPDEDEQEEQEEAPKGEKIETVSVV